MLADASNAGVLVATVRGLVCDARGLVCDGVMTSARPRQRVALRRQGDPIREIADLYYRMGWLMPDVCRAGRRPVIRCRPGPRPVDVEGTDDSYLVDINLPGVIAEDLNSELRDNQLRISGQVKDKARTGVLAPGRVGD